jgi:four helix bundle protein
MIRYSSMGDYRDLNAWNASRKLALVTYHVTESFPAAERFGLVAQMRRAAVSVMSNIAEGAGRASDRQFAPFLRIASGSLRELESQAILALELGYLPAAAHEELSRASLTAGQLLSGLLRSVERRIASGTSHK